MTVERDEAGNTWATAPGESERFVIVGGHLDSVPDGGWLDGTLNVVAGLEVLRALAPERRALTLKLVDWADEEGARFGRSLLGSSACAGSLDPDSVRGLTDRDGTRCPTRSPPTAWSSTACSSRGSRLEGAAAYLELHIEQGPVLERARPPARRRARHVRRPAPPDPLHGAHAHAGATPMDVRRDAFLAAARSALAFRDDAAAHDDVRATTGTRARLAGHRHGVQRHVRDLARPARARPRRARGDAGRRAPSAPARGGGGLRGRVGADVGDRADPVRRPADRARRRGGARRSRARSHRLPSGPLHDAAEMARVLPTVMLFVKSLGGVSHTKAEDTPEEDLELSVRALYELTRRTLAWAESDRGGRTMSDHERRWRRSRTRRSSNGDLAPTDAGAADVGDLQPRRAVGRAVDRHHDLHAGLRADRRGDDVVAGAAHRLAGQLHRADPDPAQLACRARSTASRSRCWCGRASASAARTSPRWRARSWPAAGSASRRGSAALALDTLMTTLWSGWADVAGHKAIAFGVFWLVQVAIILRGIEGISFLESCAAPLLLGVERRAADLGVRAAAGSATCSRRRRSWSTDDQSFWALFGPGLAANVGYWITLSMNIPDFTRYARDQRSQVVGQSIAHAADHDRRSRSSASRSPRRRSSIYGEAIWDPVALVARLLADLPVLLVAGDGHRRHRAALDEHGGQRRLAVERLLEPLAAPDLVPRPAA